LPAAFAEKIGVAHSKLELENNKKILAKFVYFYCLDSSGKSGSLMWGELDD
jgi:hypothetical protein